jgi:hypothetical protein
MLIEIKRWDNRKVIFAHDCENNSVKKTLELALKTNNNLRFADLSRADLSRADLSRADLSNADLRGVDLSRADLSRADLSRADLSNADLRGADLSRVDLSRADLSRADLSNADLRGADLRDANLRIANLSFANLSFANLSFANLSSANLSNADLRDAIGNMRQVFSMQLATYKIVFTKEKLFFDFKSYRIEEWCNFSDAEISAMEDNTRAWYQKWRDIIVAVIEKTDFEN